MSSSPDHDGTVEIDIAVTLSLFLLTVSCCYLVTRTLIQVCPVILKKLYQGCYLLPLVILVVVGTVMACFTTVLVVFLIAPQSTLHQKKPKILYVPSSSTNSPLKHKHIKCAPTTPSPYFTSLLPIGGTNPMSNPVMGPWSNKIHPEEGGSGGGVQKLSTIVVEGGLTTKTNPLGPFDPIPGPSVPSSIVATTAIRTGNIEPYHHLTPDHPDTYPIPRVKSIARSVTQ